MAKTAAATDSISLIMPTISAASRNPGLPLILKCAFVAKFEASQKPHHAGKKPGGEWENEKDSELAGRLFCQMSLIA